MDDGTPTAPRIVANVGANHTVADHLILLSTLSKSSSHRLASGSPTVMKLNARSGGIELMNHVFLSMY